MGEHFPELKPLGGRVKVKLNMSNQATKADLKKMQLDLIHHFLLKKTDLANSKYNVGKLDIVN